MPSTTSSSVSRLFASSTVITPSLPTLSIACEIIAPIVLSPLAAIAPTWPISSDLVILRLFALRSATIASTARSTPRLTSIGLAPAATDLAPSLTIAWARMVAVVVPSPAVLLCLAATSRTICAPMFSNLSASSISLATVTPSLVMRGAPKLLSRMTLRPFGPSVTRTALARISTPRINFSRASCENFTSLADMMSHSGNMRLKIEPPLKSGGFASRLRRALDHAHDVALFHDEELLAIELDLGSRPFAEQDAVPDFQIDWDQLAALIPPAGADGNHFAFLRLLLGGVGDDDPPLGFFFRIDALDNDTIVQRAKFHERPPLAVSLCSAEPIALARKKFGVHRRSVKGRRRKNQHSPLDAANKLISFCFLERLLHGRVGDGNIPDVQSLEKPHGQRRLPPPARGFRSDDSQHPVPHAGPSRHPAKLHLAAARSSSPFPRTEEIPRLLVARTRRPPPFGDRRSLSADQAGRVQGDRRRVPAELSARRAAGRTPLAPGPEVVDRSLRPIRIHRGDASIVTPQDSRNLRICCPEDIAFDLGFIDEA